ncbi:hypothetical protein [Micromonospora sp. NPDC092111]|uniref:hypothetical protein n=1 Tax=Micromonospora sp. NPDC092111 TaxID=3364289 RepID=UPI00381814C3
MSVRDERGPDRPTVADAAPGRCRRTTPTETYRCACGRVRDDCVRHTVHALWSATAADPDDT